MTLADTSLAREFAATLAWWQAAGVDCDFGNDARAWLADAPLAPADAPEPRDRPAVREVRPTAGNSHNSGPLASPPPAPRALPDRRDLLGDSPPADLQAFRTWWLADEALGPAGLYPRISPRGTAHAALMVLVPQPEEHDRTTLLEGPQGRLLGNMFAAMGIAPDAAYIASALPCHTPLTDLSTHGANGMDEVLAHHVALAAPQRMLVLGTGLASMLVAGADHSLREFNHASGKVAVMVSETLDAMMAMPRLKVRFWRRWMEWSASH